MTQNNDGGGGTNNNMPNNSNMPPTRRLGGGRANRNRGGASREMDSLLAEIKAKQKVEDERGQLRRKLDACTDSKARVQITEELNNKAAIIKALTEGGNPSTLASSAAGGGIPGMKKNDSEDLLEPSTNLFLNALAPDCTEDFIIQAFNRFGKIASVYLYWKNSFNTYYNYNNIMYNI